jgi:hypothetical protein
MDAPWGSWLSTSGSPEWKNTGHLETSGTLLGPEGPAAPILRIAGSRHCPRARWRDTRPYLENCTVDASIFAGRKTSNISARPIGRMQNFAK